MRMSSNPLTAVGHTPVTPVTGANFEREVVKSSLPVVVDLWAPWCGPCRMVSPVLEQLARDYAGKVKVVKVNVDEERDLAAAFQVKSIPLIVAMRGNRVVDGQVGFRGKGALIDMFDKLSQNSNMED